MENESWIIPDTDPDQAGYQVTLDVNGIPTEVIELDSSGTEELPSGRMPGADIDWM